MSFSFETIPDNIRIPFVGAEFDGSQAEQGNALLSYRGLIIGQKTTNGSAAANSLHLVTDAEQVRTLAGRDSMLYQQAKAWFKNNRFTETWILVLEDAGAGAVASGTVTFSGTATEAGTVHLLFGSQPVKVGVAVGQTAAQTATALDAALDALILADGAPVNPSVAGAVTTVAYAHRGLVGNDYKITLNYQVGEKLPAGLSVAIVQPTGGTTNPTLTTAIAALGDEWYHVWTHPYTDATSLTAIETELARRFRGDVQIDGLAVTSAPGSVATLTTLGLTRNSPHNCIMAQPGASPVTPPYEFAAAYAAQVAACGQNDPARPMQTVQLVGVLPPLVKFTDTERNVLAQNGIGTSVNAAGGVVRIDLPLTTYRLNAAGGPSELYRAVNSMLTLMYYRYSWNARIRAKYARHKLANDGTRFGPGQPVMTPLGMKAEAIAWFIELEEAGLAEGREQFKRDVRTARNGTNRNRCDVLLTPDLMNQLIVTAAKIQPRL